MSNVDPARVRRRGVATWIWLAVSGTFSLVLGLVSVLAPGSTVGVLAVLLSLWLVGVGLGRVGLASSMRTWPTARRAAQGVVGVGLAAAGVGGLLGVWEARTVVTVVVGVGFLAAALADLVLSATGPRGAGRATTGALGVLHLCIGLTFLLLPAFGLTVLSVLVGLALVVLGLVQLGAAAVVRALIRSADRLADRLASQGQDPRVRRIPGDDDPRVIRGEVL